MLAVIKTGGKQYIVKPGDKLKIEKLAPAKSGKMASPSLDRGVNNSEIIFDEVLLVEKGPKLEIGTPFVKGATVQAKVLSQGKGDKIIVFKYKAKKRYSRKIGHRQPFTEIEITGIKN